MANINDAFPSNYLKASDLKGQQPIVTIDRVEFEPVGRTKEMKPIVYFAGKDKGLVLNKTNANHIIQISGSGETDEWHGIKVKLYTAHVEFQGDTVEAIRVKAPGVEHLKAQRAKAATAANPVDAPADYDDSDIPF